jgi:DNA-binding MurR/RpiR family transcriptional regulator
MKTKPSKVFATQPQRPTWSADADKRFSASALGRHILKLLTEGSPSQRALSEFVLRDPVYVATNGIEEIARASGISPSTLSRYVRDLGLSGYPEFRSAIGETVRDLIAPVTKLGEGLSRGNLEAGAAEQSLAAADLHLRALADPATTSNLRTIVGHMAAARQVFVMGFGLSAHLAAMLVLGLQPYREGVVSVVEYGGTEVAAARLNAIAKGDMLIAITFPRYSSEIVGLTRYARDHGARIVALTDSSAAPLARLADDLVLAPAQHPVLSSSSLPGLALIEALLSEFLLSDPAHLDRARRLASAMTGYLAD